MLIKKKKVYVESCSTSWALAFIITVVRFLIYQKNLPIPFPCAAGDTSVTLFPRDQNDERMADALGKSSPRSKNVDLQECLEWREYSEEILGPLGPTEGRTGPEHRLPTVASLKRHDAGRLEFKVTSVRTKESC